MKIYTTADKKRAVDNWFDYLQNQIISQFLDLENKLSKSPRKISVLEWKKDNPKNGGGKSMIIKNGKIFDTFSSMTKPTSGKFVKVIEEALNK